MADVSDRNAVGGCTVRGPAFDLAIKSSSPAEQPWFCVKGSWVLRENVHRSELHPDRGREGNAKHQKGSESAQTQDMTLMICSERGSRPQ